MASSSPAIGIDLGTTNSCAAVHDGTRPRVLRSSLGYTTIPSVLTFGRDGERVVGQQAERQLVFKPEQCVYGSKRLLGRACLQSALQRFQPHFAYELVADKRGQIAAQIGERVVPLVDVSALILGAIREAAETALERSVRQVVITVPAYFHENQRALVRQAGELAGLEVLQIISEPTAAALSFGAHSQERKHVLVFDLGGGTFDVSIVRLGGSLEVVGVDGDSFLGGLDFDRRLAELVRSQLSRQLGRDAQLTTVGQARLLAAVRTAKHDLSSQPRATVSLRCFGLADGTSMDVEQTVTLAAYEAACTDLLTRMSQVTRRALDRTGVRPQQIDEVLLVGGQTRMPAVQQLIRTLFGKEPTKRVHPDEAVALGAAIAAHAAQSGRDEAASLVHDLLPMPIGTAVDAGQFMPLIPRNTALPAETVLQLWATPLDRELRLPLFQGEGSHVLDNEFLGVLLFEGLPRKSKQLELEAVLSLDAEGLLSAGAQIRGNHADLPASLTYTDDLPALLAAVSQQGLRIEVQQASPPEADDGAAHDSGPYGSARVEPPRRSWWQRLLDRFRRG